MLNCTFECHPFKILRNVELFKVIKMCSPYGFLTFSTKSFYACNACLLTACDFQVNGQNVVKVGHRQVVNMIRQGGNSLMVKVVMVARNPELEETARKKGKSNPPMSFLSCVYGVSAKLIACLLHSKGLLQWGCHW